MIRRARADDAPAIHALLHEYASRDLLLPRPLADIYDRIRDFWVATDSIGQVVGCAALRIWWHDLAEIRSLAVSNRAEGRGYGKRLVEAVAHEASRYGILVLFSLTRVEQFFTRCGFLTVDRAVLYNKVWGDCAVCPKRTACDEVAMVRPLVPGAADALLAPAPQVAARVRHVVPPRAPGMPERLPVAPRESGASAVLAAPRGEPRRRRVSRKREQTGAPEQSGRGDQPGGAQPAGQSGRQSVENR